MLPRPGPCHAFCHTLYHLHVPSEGLTPAQHNYQPDPAALVQLHLSRALPPSPSSLALTSFGTNLTISCSEMAPVHLWDPPVSF